ncbi:MAG: glucosamine-6-phosphate deaminase [Spirochaetota bacterium]
MGSRVEQTMLERTGQVRRYPEDEHIAVIVVDNFPMLGTFAAARFLEWVQDHPGGVISLPTGKTPQYFIAETTRFLEGWQRPEIAGELESLGVDPERKPDMSSLRFVQIDEFYPVNPRHTNSFYYYVEKYYLDGFGIPTDRSLLINTEQIGIPEGETLESVWGDDAVDLSLRYRRPRSRREHLQRDVIHRVDEWCAGYEDAVRELGGIGFFLGGIGPDGHIAFNVRGSDRYSTTRLAPINYETQAAAAGDLGGIEVARKRLTITVGLSTITHNRDVAAIVLAAGEAKAAIVADAVESPAGIERPASALHGLPNSAFYLTRGAAKRLTRRQVERLRAQPELDTARQHQIVIDVALRTRRRLAELTETDLRADPFGEVLLDKAEKPVADLLAETEQTIRSKFDSGMKIRSNCRFLHTEPHHDDVMLGYLPYVVRHIREHSNAHYFATFTSGFTAVTNAYMLGLSRRLLEALRVDRYGFSALTADGYFDAENDHYRDHDVWLYLDGLASMSDELQQEGTLRRLYRNLVTVFEDSDLSNLTNRVEELVNYFETQYPGKKDLGYIQTLKGMVREYESECLWGYFGWNSAAIEHLRLGFYKGEIFTEDPSVARDVVPVLDLLRRVKPDVVTVAFDPEASGPDTHYKVLQSIAEALRLYREETGRDDIEVWGYRNVWYRFDATEADLYIPVSLNMLTLQHESFMHSYGSQKNASFPSYELEGPFSLLAQEIQVEQYEQLATLLGREFFYEHEGPLVRATRGFTFLKTMTLDEFFTHSRTLRSQAEARE